VLESTKLSEESTTSPATSALPGLTVEQHRDHVVASGISDFVALKYGLRGISRLEAMELGFKGEQARAGLLLPLYWNGSEPVLHQLRPWVPRIAPDSKPIRYETPAGKANVLATHPAWVDRIPAPNVPLIFTEGTKKLLAWATKLQLQGDRALRLNEVKIADPIAISLMGVRGWMGENEFGGRGIPLAALREIPFRGKDAKGEFKRQVVLAFDSDVMTKPDVHDALAELHAYLSGRGAEVWVMYLPSLSGAKVGLDDFLAAGHSLQDALNCCEPKLRPLAAKSSWLTFADLLTLPPLPWLVNGLLPAEGVTVMYGDRGAYKSFLILDWLACVSGAAPDWFGLPVHKHGPSVYVYSEGRSGLGQRVQAVRLTRHLPDDTPLVAWPTALDLTDAKAVERFIVEIAEALRGVPPAVVAIDTLARNMPGKDENKQVDMNAFIASCDRIRTAFNCQVIVVHHTNREGTIRGSTVLAGAADTLIEVERQADRETLLTLTKQKDSDHGPARTVQLRPEAASLVVCSVESTKTPAKTERDELLDYPKKALVFRALGKAGREGLSYNDWLQASEVSKGTFSEAKAMMEDRDFVFHEKETGRYRLTVRGVEIAVHRGWVEAPF
jgi:hypothetical protein